MATVLYVWGRLVEEPETTGEGTRTEPRGVSDVGSLLRPELRRTPTGNTSDGEDEGSVGDVQTTGVQLG